MGLHCLFLPSVLSHSWKLYRKGSRESQPQIQRSKRQTIWDHLEYIPEKPMATHSSTLAWKIPWTEPGRLQSMGSLRVGHDSVTSLSHFTFIHWRRKWQPTPVFLPGESQGWWSRWAAVYGVAQSRTRLKRLSSSSRKVQQNDSSVCESKNWFCYFSSVCNLLSKCQIRQLWGMVIKTFSETSLVVQWLRPLCS